MIENTIKYNVHETFQDTLQGEGFQAGRVCDFIRLYGCPVGCWFCDTGYASPDGDYYKKKLPKNSKSLEELLAETKSKLIVISGGEPFIHKKLPELCAYLIRNGKDVAIETSGAFWLEVPKEVFITLSPKEHLNPKMPVKEQFWTRANELKIVISAVEDFEFYKEKSKTFKGYKYLQPEFYDGKESVQKTINLLLKNYDFKLSLQTHKIIDIQ
tara:strand:- start:270 stop:908 length:639 start_codon:yes stop_codon:yes gene_type:complete